jgi:pullulanase/glycogen debranching enzyme
MSAAVNRSRVTEVGHMPGGATWTGRGANFSLFSASATRVEFCLFDDSGETKLERIELPEYTNEIWHGFLPDARRGTVYGYRVHGPLRAARGTSLIPDQARAHPTRRRLSANQSGGRRSSATRWSRSSLNHENEAFAHRTTWTFEERDSASLCRSAGSSIPPHLGATTAPEWKGRRKGIARRLR